MNQKSHILDITDKISVLSNHPVHILDEEGTFSPSAFIPFCHFGNQKNLGTALKQFDQPVCNIFKKKIIQDQLCYEANIQQDFKTFSDDNTIGLSFLVDSNKDRQLSFDKDDVDTEQSITFGMNKLNIILHL